MFKACSRCGKIHDTKHRCNHNRTYQGGQEREQRNTYAWAQKAIEIKQKAQYLCEVCRDRNERYTYDGLEVHHIIKLRDYPQGLLDDFNLVCLCVRHHKEADKGKINKEYLQNLARGREEK